MRKIVSLAALGTAVLAFSALGGVGERTEAAEARPAAACVLPANRPLWIDFGVPELASVFGRPGVTMAVSTGDFPARMRQAGARTIYWDMNLNNRVGLPTAPAAPETMVDKGNRLYEFAATQMGCSTPWIVLNELFGSHLETPWSENNTTYRQNVLTLMKTLSERGAKPLLLLSTNPFTGTEAAAAWWREAATYGDLVKEVYFGAPSLHKQGPILANRRLRVAFRRGIESLTSIGIPPRKIGIALGFQTAPGTGGRERLQPSSAWYRVIKWQALAARQVAKETGIAHIVSWGWGTYRADAADPDKPRAACVYLWTRDPDLCNAPGTLGAQLNTSLTEGQIVLPRGAQCVAGRRTITRAQLAALSKLTGDRDIAYSILLARLAESPHAAVLGKQIVAAERAVLAARFRRSVGAYRAALARVGGNVALARGALADELRRMQVESRLAAPRATAAEIHAFYTSYPEILARVVEARPAPWWLGRRTRGLALEPLAPRPLFTLAANRAAKVLDLDSTYRVKPLGVVQPLGSVPLVQARPAIASALAAFDRRAAFERWSVGRQEALLRSATCLRDDLPAPGTIRLTGYLPFLSTAGS